MRRSSGSSSGSSFLLLLQSQSPSFKPATLRPCLHCKLRSSLATSQQLRRAGAGAGARATLSFNQIRKRYASSSSHSSSSSLPSTLVSATAVDGPKDVLPAFQQLHRALERVSRDASNYVNVSRLRLALLGLASTNPVIRVAVLGFQGSQSPKQLVKFLLANHSAEAAAWEHQLDSLDLEGQRSVILRYGDGSEPSSNDALGSTYYIASEVLRNHNLEILISSTGGSIQETGSPIDIGPQGNNVLVHLAETSKTLAGSIAYPVHQALIIADGIGGCFSLGKYAGIHRYQGTKVNSVIHAVNLSQSLESQEAQSSPEDVAVIDLVTAGKALSKVRRMAWDEKAFKDAWSQTGISKLSTWFQQVPRLKGRSIHPAVKELIVDLLNETTKEIEKRRAAMLLNAIPHPGNDQTRHGLDVALKSWAERAHTELRNGLDSAFMGRSWLILKWWRLPWRVDDVYMIVTELLEQHWLPEAEKSIIWLSGRCSEAGYSVHSNEPVDLITTDRTGRQLDTPINEWKIRSQLQSQVPQKLSIYPWSSTIQSSRNMLKNASVPPLQALAQALLLQTSTITAMTSALAALSYCAFSAATLYNTGAIAALGLVWSLRRAQRKWEDERKMFEDEVRESGRATLKRVEGEMRAQILGQAVGSASETDKSLESMDEALRAVGMAKAEVGLLSSD